MNEPANRIRLRRLEITNYQAIKYIAFDIAPGITPIAGRTAQGKSTIPQGIRELLQKGGVSSRPLRNGAAEGSIRAEFSDGSVGEKKITAKGTQPFRRTMVDGMKGGLESVAGWISDEIFDPLAFGALAATKPGRRAQAETIMEIAGGDTSEIDEERVAALAEESAAGKAAADLEAQARGVVVPGDVAFLGEERPIVDRVDLVAIAGKRGEAVVQKAANDEKRRAVDAMVQGREAAARGCDVAERDAEAAQAALDRAIGAKRIAAGKLIDAQAAEDATRAAAAALVDIDTTAIDAEIAAARAANATARAEAEAHNRSVRAAVEQHAAHLRGMAERAKLETRAKAARAEERAAAARKKEADGQKAAAIAEAAAKMPIAGLTIEGIDREVFLNGAPLSQASTRERMAIGCAIALARNPRLGLLWIDYGNELDADAEAWLQDFLAANDADAFVVHVVDDPATAQGIVVEGGEILADRRENIPTATAAPKKEAKPKRAKAAPLVVKEAKPAELETALDDDDGAPPADG